MVDVSAIRKEPVAGEVEQPRTIPLSVPDLRGNEAKYLTQCVETNWISSAGSFVTDFEKETAALAGAGHGVAIVNGTCALELALRVVGVKAGMSVIVPDWTFVATANAVRHIGAETHFIDVTRSTWTMDPACLEEAIRTSKTPIGAIVPVHALGHPADLDPIHDIAADYGIPVVEDGAGAIGAQYKGRPVGSGRSKAVMFSFNGNKLLTSGNGGMIVTDDKALADHARSLSAQARQGDAYRFTELAFNYRMSNVNAAIGMAQMERFPEMLAERQKTATVYRDALSDSKSLTFMPEADWAVHNGWMSVAYCDSVETADALLEAMHEARIDARAFWESLSAQPAYRQAPRTLTGVTASFDNRMVALPSSSSLSDADRERVCAVLKRFH